MRVTDQVTNQVALDTGIAVNANSLANVSDSPTGNALLDELNKSDSNKASAVTKNKYEEVGKHADALIEIANIFLADGSGSLLSGLDTEEGRAKIAEQLDKLVNGYNGMLGKLKTSTSALDMYYAQMLGSLVSDNASGLGQLGIIVSAQGKLQFDNSKLKNADADTVTNTLGTQSDFMQKLSFISEHISDNAKAGLKSLGNTYNSNGFTSSAALAGYFDTRR